MYRLLSLLLIPVIACFAAKPTEYSTDIVMLEGNQVVKTMRLYASGQKSRLEGVTAGQLGTMIAITRTDKGVAWTLFVDKRQYTETALTGNQPGKVDLANFDQVATGKQVLGKETVLGYSCTKMRATMGKMPNGQPLVATVWVADSLELPVRLEMMGTIQENRNLKVGPQPAGLFEIPAGFTKTGAPGMPAGMTPPAGVKVPASISAAKSATTVAQTATAPAGNWKTNTNYPGGDYRSFEVASADPTSCKAACDKEAPCKAWTFVKPEPGGMGACWLKDTVPPASTEECCISGLKSTAGVTASKYQLEYNVNRGGDDYRDFVPAQASAEVCAEACAKDSRCRAWTWVNSELEPPTGHCWLKNRAPEPGRDTCCVSGVKK